MQENVLTYNVRYRENCRESQSNEETQNNEHKKIRRQQR